jgi:hypothetical protein
MACPGSVKLSEQFPDTETAAAREGTLAHEYAASQLDPGLISRDVSADMAAHVAVYVEHCRALTGAGSTTAVERNLMDVLRTIDPDLGGTADFIAHEGTVASLDVVDLKYGAGVLVPAKDNPQLKLYGLGALLEAQRTGRPVRKVFGTIVQPRIDTDEGPIRHDYYTVADLLDFAAEVQAAAKLTRVPDAPLVPGEKQCKFCPAKAICPELTKQRTALVAADFPVMPGQVVDREKLAAALAMIPQVKGQIQAIEDLAMREILAGRPVAGVKVVEKRATRKWADEDSVALVAVGNAIDPYAPAALKSPAQLEKDIGKATFKELFASLAPAVSSGYSLVSESDKRPAIAAVSAADFPLLTSEES